MKKNRVIFIQLPFPSTSKPDKLLQRYCRYYSLRVREILTDYFIPSDGLWELPSYWAFLSGNFRHYDQILLDLSRQMYVSKKLLSVITQKSVPEDTILFSPLTQNFDITLEITKKLSFYGYKRIVIGGNMSSVVDEDGDFIVCNSSYGVDKITAKKLGLVNIDYNATPDFTILAKHYETPPIFRLFPNLGCKFGCPYCIEPNIFGGIRRESEISIKRQVEQMQTLFPETKIWYNSDKTFGQDKEALFKLYSAFGSSLSEYRGITQTRPEFVLNPFIVEWLKKLNIVIVEFGFETANIEIRRRIGKPQPLELIDHAIEILERNGIKVVLNVLMGLPWETDCTYQETLDYLLRCNAWLFNIYNFVPYPRTALYTLLKKERRIVDYNWRNWREDAPLVYEPYFLSREKHWEWFQKIVTALTRKITEVYIPNPQLSSHWVYQ